MNEKYNVTTSTYEKKYDSGYGLQYPDGHIIFFIHIIFQRFFYLNKLYKKVKIKIYEYI